MEPIQLGYATNSVVPPQEQVFEQVYMKVQGEFGIEGLIGLVRYVTDKAIQERENTLKNLEAEVKEVKRAIDMMNEVMPDRPMAKIPY
jgi:hypothetical protein